MGIFNKRKSKELLRDEKKHIRCNFIGNENKCQYSCDDCAIAIKTEGDYALSKGLYDEAIRLYKLAISKEPVFAEAWVNLGNSYGNKSDYRNALLCFENAVDYDKTYGKALLGRAITLKNMGLLDEAIECLDSIIKLYDNESCKKIKTDILELKSNKNAVNNNSATIDDKFFVELIRELVSNGVNKGYITDKLPYVPEISMLQTQYISRCFNELKRIGETGVQLLELSLVWAFYGGMGAVVYWNTKWDELQNSGIYECLATERGVDCLDEFVTDLIGMKWESNEEIRLREFIFESKNIAMTYMSKNTSDKNNNAATMFQDTMKAMFQLGVGFELNRLGMR
jgi:tetratricopeptide (TPR) repeat protein